MEIKTVTLDDLDELQRISRQTFADTFAEVNSEANMKRYLEEELSKEKLSAELRDTDSLFYFVTEDHKVIGYLKLNFGASQTELNDIKATEIERIYVAKEFLGKNVGQFLYDKALETARKKSSDYLWLGVWEENQRAINFYKKNGFVVFDKHIFRLGDDEQTDLMMKLKL